VSRDAYPDACGDGQNAPKVLGLSPSRSRLSSIVAVERLYLPDSVEQVVGRQMKLDPWRQ
jgi:hypothetical protein